LCVKNTACTIRHITYAKSIRLNLCANYIFADSVSVHCVPCVEHLLHVDREKGTSKPNCQAFDQVNGRTLRWTPQSRSSRCKGSSLSALGACQSSRQQINIWFPPCFLPIPMDDMYTWQRLIRVPSVSTPLLFRFFNIRSAGTPAPRVCPTSATCREATSGLKERCSRVFFGKSSLSYYYKRMCGKT